MTAKMEYADYLARLSRNSQKSAQELNKEALVCEVGKEYGLSEREMDEVARSVENS